MKFNLLIPIAGHAHRFREQGYDVPKPLIVAKTKQVIDWALESINTQDCNLIFAVRQEHIRNFAIDNILSKKFGPNTKIVVVDYDTEGTVSTCLLAKNYIDNDTPLIVFTPDVSFSPRFDPASVDETVDGLILTFKANSPAHSYALTDDNGLVVKTAEKQVISPNAAVGVYYFRTGQSFVHYAEMLIRNNIRTRNEFYVCPMYNLLIKDKLKVTIQQVDKLHVLGTPEDLEFFVNNVTYNFGERPIGLCGDHSGFHAKEAAKEILDSLSIPYIDFGCEVNKDIDYNSFIIQACRAINDKTCDFAFGFCRTGQGINILANHQRNIRAALIFDQYTAEMSRRHNCANFFSIPSKYVNIDLLTKIIKSLRDSSFDGGRHMARVKGKTN
jgi:RpiB/LacA/LacB family sugar-phosphate isomerase